MTRAQKKRRPRRHERDPRRDGQTLCGRSIFRVPMADAKKKYPLDRSNCLSCGDVRMGRMREAFNDVFDAWSNGDITTDNLPAAEQFAKDAIK